MNVAVVTGGTGFIGSHLTRRLIDEGWIVHILKRSSSSLETLRDLSDKIIFHDVDQQSLTSIWRSIGTADVVYHLATAYGREGQTASEVVETNVLFSLRLLENALAHGVSLFVATDTCFTPDYPYLQHYTLSKKQFVQWGALISQDTDCRIVNLVLQHPFGPEDGIGKFVPWIMRQCIENTPSIDLTSGLQKKDFIYVSDVVDAYLILATQMSQLPMGFSEIPCGSGNPIEIRYFIGKVHELAKSTSNLNFGALALRVGEPSVSFADIQILSSLGWTPRTNLDDAIDETLASMRSEG